MIAMDMKKLQGASFGEFMSFTHKGFSWAEIICQRVESICTENKTVQNPAKCVNSVGERFKTMFDNLCETADDVLELIDLSLRNTALVKESSSGNVGEDLDDNVLEKNMGSALSTKEYSIPDPGDKNLISYNATPDKNYACAKLESQLHLVEDLNHSKSTTEHWFLNGKYGSTDTDSNASIVKAADVKGSSLCFPDAAASDIAFIRSRDTGSSMTNDSNLTGEPLPIQSLGTLETKSHDVESNESEIERQNGCEITSENLISVNKEELLSNSSFSCLNIEEMSEYSELNEYNDLETEELENEWDDIVKQEIVLISSRAFQKESCKTKVKKMFTSRWRSSTRKELVINYHDDLQSKTDLESGWELV